jgi:hypothetical protein
LNRRAIAAGCVNSAGARRFRKGSIMTLNLTTTVLGGMSGTPPEIDGDSLFGTVVVWADGGNNDAVTLAFSGSSPAYAPSTLNPAWRSFDTPAVAIATEWEKLFVAFTDQDGFVQLVSSGDGWTGMHTLSPTAISNSVGPALAYSDPLLYMAWQSPTGQLVFATRDKNGKINTFASDAPLTSRPTICADDPSRIYVLCGGSVASGPSPIKIYLSIDGGETFSNVTTPLTTCFGPPSLVQLDQFYLAWADGQTSQLRLAQTADLGSYTPMVYNVGCHNGGPAIIPVATVTNISDPENPASWVFTLSSGWTTGSSDSNNHHVTVGTFGPLTVGAPQLAKQQRRIARRRAPRAPDPCPDPLTVFDPATNKCVPRGGCIGGCVLSAFTGSVVGPVFNPIKYALCVITCEARS